MKGWVTLSADFRVKGASHTNHYWCQKTRVIAVSCGIKIFAVRCLVLSQYTHLTHGRTDGQTDRQNCDSNTMRCITCSRTVKMTSFFGKKATAQGHKGQRAAYQQMYQTRATRTSDLVSLLVSHSNALQVERSDIKIDRRYARSG